MVSTYTAKNKQNNQSIDQGKLSSEEANPTVEYGANNELQQINQSIDEEGQSSG
jgi:hypothetical protein